MTGLNSISSSFVAAAANHVWQSTLFALAAALLTLAVRHNRAAVRHALWTAAVVKFLVPFALLASIGQLVSLRAPVPAPVQPVTAFVEAIGQPFAPVDPSSAPAPASRPLTTLEPIVPVVAAAIWLAGAVVLLLRWWTPWRTLRGMVSRGEALTAGPIVDALRRIERAAGIRQPIPVIAVEAPLVPGVFGVWRPLLLWSRALADQLSRDQTDAILIHEVAHVRRRDNLSTAAYMTVETLFWFHPIVWWIGRRLVDERERACDEAVLGTGQQATVYAETIVASCRIVVDSARPCVVGMAGSDLKKRIERIMQHRPPATLTTWKRATLAMLALASISGPALVGAASARVAPAKGRQAAGGSPMASHPEGIMFTASIKPSTSLKRIVDTGAGGRFTATGVTLKYLIQIAYDLQDYQISGGPSWIDNDRFDVAAKLEGENANDAFRVATPGAPSQGDLMLRSMLETRFKLGVHLEDKEQPIYVLNFVKPNVPGPQLRTIGACDEATSSHCGIQSMPGTLKGQATLRELAQSLSALVGRAVRDGTGSKDTFDVMLSFTPERLPAPGYADKAKAMGLPPIDPDGPTLLTALRDKLGLKLDSQKGLAPALTIDRAEKPTKD